MRRRSTSSSWLAAGAGVALGGAAVFFLAPDLAAPTLVDDGAALMTAEQQDFLGTYHGLLIDDHDIDYRVVTVSDAGDINRFAVDRFETLFAGSRSGSGRGLLLVVDPAQDLVRLEVAFALEGVFPDAFIAYVENRQMVPFFRTNRIADGILAATELIVTRAQRAEANAGFETEAWATASGGGGAVARARIGQGAAPTIGTSGRPTADLVPGGTPAETLERYFAAMRARNSDPDLAFYTPDTRSMLHDWTVTPAQMDSVVNTYGGCRAEAARFSRDGRLAVVRYPIDERACAPFFFRQIDNAWALDLTMMQKAIRFGRTNAWRLDPAADHPYGFAFDDWRFNRNGFPVGVL